MDERGRTSCDVLTGLPAGMRVTHPDRLSHALITLGNCWQIGGSVSPGSQCSSGLGRLLALGEIPDDVMGRAGSPAWWFGLAADAEVAIKQDDGRWYVCETYPPHPPATMQTWGYVTPDQLCDLIERVGQQPGGCLCPACSPSQRCT